MQIKKGCWVPYPEKLKEAYEIGDNMIIANVGVDHIEQVMQQFIAMHDEPLFFILELPAKLADEVQVRPGVVEKLHKDIYYIDGCSQEEALTIMLRAGDLLFNDGLSAFGYGGHVSEDEIMFGKYNVLTIYSKQIQAYKGLFEANHIVETTKLVTAWDTFSTEHPGRSSVYKQNEKDIFSIPEQFKEWGMYHAEQREED